jgi:ribosomal protein L40E
MSQAHSVQCLFCHSLNPSGAAYCDRCDEQLDLQPCNRCGAVDHRTATVCHKCGGPFSSPVAPGLAPLFMPAVKSADVDVKLIRQASSDTRVANSKAEHLDELTHSRPEEPPVDDVRWLEPPSTVAKVRRRTVVAVSSTFLVLITTAVSLYLYSGRAAQPVLTQVQMQDVTPPLAPPAPDAATTASPLPAVDAEIKDAQNPSAAIRCEPAVATLGLCNLDSQTEKP